MTRKMVPITGRANSFLVWGSLRSPNKHSCQFSRMGLRDKTTPSLTTPLIRDNMSCAVATIFSSLAFLSSFSMAGNLSHLVAASFYSLALLSSSDSMSNLSCLLATTFSSLGSLQLIVVTSLQSFESGQALFLLVLFFYFRVLSSAFLSCVFQFLKLFALSFTFLSESSFFVHAKAALAYSRNE